MQSLNVIFDSLNQLSLVFPDGSTDVRANEQSVESREDEEHLVGILRCSELITQPSSDPGFDTIDSLVISGGGVSVSELSPARHKSSPFDSSIPGVNAIL